MAKKQNVKKKSEQIDKNGVYSFKKEESGAYSFKKEENEPLTPMSAMRKV